MTDGDTDCDTNCPRDCKYAKEASADPWFYRFSYRVSITESLEADLFNLRLFRLISIKHAFSLGEWALYHQDERAPSVDQHGYPGIYLELREEGQEVSRAITFRQHQHRHPFQI